jgi:DNA helicase-2/ATP-dependent DNA helicase PcrA
LSLFRLTDEQESAVNHLSGNLQIIACAGSGKTEVVSRRVAMLIKNGASPRSIVAFTFTEKAAEELKARIREILDRVCPDRADIGEMYVGTIHSFCFEMLRELEPRYRGFDVLDDPRRVAFISMPHRYYSSHLRTLETYGKYEAIRKFFASCDIVRMENIDIEEVSNEDFVEAYKRYEEFLDEDRYLDFSSMIHRLVKLVETNENAKRELNKRIDHLVVDEYQDINELQEKLIRHISDGCKTLCVVGDDDQCIYNWRGSTVDNIINFSQNYPEVTRIPVSNNFRSTEKIIKCATSYIKNNRRRLPKDMKPREKPVNSSEPDDLFYRHFDSEDEEFRFIMQRINELVGTDFYDKKGNPFSLSYGDFAILARTNKEGAKIVPYLDGAGIPLVVDIGGEVFNRPEVILSLKCLAYIFQMPYNDEWVTKQGLLNDYINVFARNYPQADPDSFIKIIEETEKEILAIMAKGKGDYLPMGLQPYFHRIIKAFGADRFEFEEAPNYHLAVLSHAIADYESVWRRLRAREVKYFFGFIQAYGSSAYSDTSHSDPSLINAVKVLTIHRAKGLEFPVVFIPGFVKERKPRREELFVDENLYDVDRYGGDVEDERRVYYTAITRSMKYLFITGSTHRMKRDGSPYKITFGPHPFAWEITRGTSFSAKAGITRKKSGYQPRKLSSNLFPTSFSDLNCYRRCGYDYLLRNVYGYQAGVPPAFGYGARIHNILNIIYKGYIASKKIPAEEEVEELFEEHFILRYAPGAMAENMKKGGIRVVKNYVELNTDDFSRVLETEKRFELAHGEALIAGVIDLLKKFDEKGELEEVEVIDFKTEKEIDSIYEKDYELQLRLYAIACFRSLGLKPRKAVIHHLDVKEGKSTRTSVDISPPMLEKAGKELKETISKIIGKTFNPRPSERCLGCDWRRICSQKTKTPAVSGADHKGYPPEKHEVPTKSKTKTIISKQSQFASFVAELKEKGITGSEYRRKIMQWAREHQSSD